jgi:hypothetical protein
VCAAIYVFICMCLCLCLCLCLSAALLFFLLYVCSVGTSVGVVVVKE